ncbi:putative zinc-type alcohol dehydrogenase-like protein PB24D3.08c [Xylariaceae sp. AK1471]|nr:putative zinc-type alcohol dehydrogenase-like protein PB24D3.08c [Xylariaceae sp. AK1471]
MQPNQILIYKNYAPGAPIPSDNLVVKSRPFNIEAKPPSRGITVKNMYLSKVLGFAAASEYSAIPETFTAKIQVLPSSKVYIPLSTMLTTLGATGPSAYTIIISAVNGAVGQIVRQLYRMHVIRVDFVNYKTKTTAEVLDQLAPEGLDMYYSNVRSEQLEIALMQTKDFRRIISNIMNGMVLDYKTPVTEKNDMKTLTNIVFKRLARKGFICSDAPLLAKYMPSFAKEIIGWVSRGKIKVKEDIPEGMANATGA